jgi:uncharacterized protein (TIGR01777 family)
MRYLITGGTGLVGKKLCKLLLEKRHEVCVLSRTKKTIPGISTHLWNPEKEIIDRTALENVDIVIHLAGAGIADKRWTQKRKAEIIESRVQPLLFLTNAFKKTNQQPKKIISASGISIYGFDSGDQLMTEVHAPGNDYISDVVVKWEKAVDSFASSFNIDAVKLRIGIVLAKEGGALPKLALPIKLGIGSPIGNGQQWVSWIHIDDLCQMFLLASENDHYQRVYNAVAPNPETNEDLLRILANILEKPFWAPNVPEFILKLLMGEVAQLVLGSNKVSSVRIEEAGFEFRFPELKDALNNIYYP